MFRGTMCPSSGETNMFMQHLVLVIVYGLLSGMQCAYNQLTSTGKNKILLYGRLSGTCTGKSKIHI